MSNELEIKKLKVKINKQIDGLEERDSKITQLKKQLKSSEDECLSLMEKNKNLHKKVEKLKKSARADAQSEFHTDEVTRFFEVFGIIIKKIHQNGEFIPYKNATKYSGCFCKVERNVFDNYVQELVGDDQKEFLTNCKGFLCIKSESDGKCIYNNDKIRVYFLNRKLISTILNDIAPGAEAPAAKVM